MKKFNLFLAFFILSALLSKATVFAFEGFQAPIPAGQHYITQGYYFPDSGAPKFTHEGYELDFQTPDPDEALSYDCYSYGVPIVAMKPGKVVWIENRDYRLARHDTQSTSLGQSVVIRHSEDEYAVYGHMIKGTPQQYISLGDQVEPGQIIGLMGDTGKVFGSKNKKGERIHCQDLPYDLSPFDETIKEGWGTHLHLELLTGNKFAGEKFTTIKPEPLGSANSVNLKKGVFTSYTTSSDLDGNYSKYHYGRYPYTLKLEKVYSITPLRASPGSSTSFELKGESFSEKSPLKIPFCNSQSFQFIDEHTAVITCQILGNGLAEGTFSNPDQPEGILKYQIDISSQSSGSPEISELNFITAKPGEFMNFHILGKNLPGDLKVVVVSKNFPGEEGVCDTKHSFSFLSPGSIKTQCRLPLNLGPVEQQNDQPFKVTVSHQGQVLASKDFEINYGISAANLLPRTALYYTPTRFTIIGKNVHRTTVFFIEGCDKKDLKVISQKYDELVLECLIQPKPGTDLSTIQGKTFPHLFLFKTQSRFNEQGASIFDDEEDRAHVVVSGFIDVTYDKTEKVESISPSQAIIGKSTIFTVTGKNLPYGDENSKKYSAWLEYCSTGAKGLQIIPESYTPYGFDFQCTPEFNQAVTKGKSDFDLSKAPQMCDSILEQNWSEAEKNKALEKCYESDSRAVKTSMWQYFDRFFETLAPRKLHVKKSNDLQKILVSEQSVKFVSSLYDFIKNEEAFQFQYQRENGDYVSNGPAVVTKVLAGEITRKNRHQTITVLGENLPWDLDIVSDECAQKAITYGSSEHFEFVCLLQKVPVQEIRIVDAAKQTELSRTYTDLVEVYEVEASSADKKTMLHLRGVNFTPNMTLFSENCLNFISAREPSSTEMVYSCDLSVGIFSSSDSLDLKVSSADGVLLFDGVVNIQRELPEVVVRPPSNETFSETLIDQPPLTSVQLANQPLFESKLITLLCEASEDDVFFLGECRMSSEFIREAFVNASYDKQVRLAVMEGSFDTRLGKAVDDFAANRLYGLKLNPASGNGLIILDIEDQSLLMNGQVKAIGFDATEVLGFPFAFDLYDYSGQLIVTYPYFDVNKPREKSKIVLGIGQVPGEHITLFKKESDELKKRIEENMKAINVALNKKKIEIGAKLVGSIENTTLKKLARTSYIKVLKALEIVPEAVGFYDNYDFIAKGKLKSEPFRPPSWPEDASWGFEANLATVDVDFMAKDAKLVLKGDALNSLSLFNNDILKTDRGLINLGITVALKDDNGRIDLDRVEVRLPGDFASARADAHMIQIFKPEDLTIWGTIDSRIGIGAFELAEAGAGFRYDPNMEYWIGSQKTLGLLQLESQMKMVALLLAGKAVFTLPEREELVMDIGGSLDLDFLGYNQRLADILGRGRIHSQYMRGCFNSETAEIKIKIPYYARLPLLAITSDDTITLHGGFSADTQVNFGEDDVSLRYFAMSGQAIDDSRIGFRYDGEKNWLSAFSLYEDVCHDAPGKEFLENVLPRMNAPVPVELASHSSF